MICQNLCGRGLLKPSCHLTTVVGLRFENLHYFASGGWQHWVYLQQIETSSLAMMSD